MYLTVDFLFLGRNRPKTGRGGPAAAHDIRVLVWEATTDMMCPLFGRRPRRASASGSAPAGLLFCSPRGASATALGRDGGGETQDAATGSGRYPLRRAQIRQSGSPSPFHL
eukprot:Polyplicarium_translucidae@DN1588_c0_g1_i1.p3